MMIISAKPRGYPEDRRKIERRFDDLFTEYEGLKTYWQELSKHIAPERGIFDDYQPNRRRGPNGKIVINSTPLDANDVFAAGMQSGMTPMSRPWFLLNTMDPELAAWKPVQVYSDLVTQRIRDVLARTNIYECTHNIYEELGAFGIGAMGQFEDYDRIMRGEAYTIGEYAVGTGADGRVNAYARKLKLTVGQVVEKFGKKACSQSVQEMYERGRLSERVDVYHLCEVNDERIPGLVTGPNKPFRSVYWQPGTRKDEFLAVRGFEEFPYLVPRWKVTRTMDYYGIGPGGRSLSDCKMLQKIEQEKLKQITMTGTPPMKAPSSMRGQLVNLIPGGITFGDDAGTSGLEPMYQINPNIAHLSAEIQGVAERIKSAFHVDMFLMMIESDRRQMTATEVQERQQEKLLILGPALERLQNDFLDPLVGRTFNILNRAGMLPPPPKELHGQLMKVEYISILAQAQKAVATNAISRVTAFAGNLAAIQPEILDVVNLDEAVRRYGEALGVTPEMIRSVEEIQAIRQQRAQAQQQQQAMMDAMAQTQAAKNLASSDITQPNALTAILGGGGL